MSFAAKARRAPGRISAGMFVLGAGVQKLSGDENTAKAIHGMAANAYPFLHKVPPRTFLKLLACTEIGVGSVLLLPIFGPKLAGAALTGFSGGLLGLYWRTPEMHDKYGMPTLAGTAMAKDTWLNAIGTALLLDAKFGKDKVAKKAKKAK